MACGPGPGQDAQPLMEKLEKVLSKTNALGQEERHLQTAAALCPQARNTGVVNTFKSK